MQSGVPPNVFTGDGASRPTLAYVCILSFHEPYDSTHRARELAYLRFNLDESIKCTSPRKELAWFRVYAWSAIIRSSRREYRQC